ncbi:MAG: SpoIIE family protein phosphatase [Gemmataceae bacterium]|nr:SpoIIE family protein phosphatase [Gemmataceae bacterium]
MPMLVLLKSPDGPAPRRQIPLTGEPQTIGRDAERCQIVIPHASVSREHARITQENGIYYIEDLNSRNHTFVNSRQITERTRLNPDDRIRICDYLFVFQVEKETQVRPRPLTSDWRKGASAEVDDEGGQETATTIEASGNQDSVRHFLQAAPSERLRALLDISRSLSSTLELEPLLRQVTDVLFQVFRQADRCFVLLMEENRLVPKVVKTRRASDETPRYSRTVVRRAFESGQSFLTEDASMDASLGGAVSIAELRIRSAMCVPMIGADGQPIGAIQIDTLDRGRKFTQDDLHLLTIVGNMAGVAIQKAFFYEQSLKRQREEKEIELARKVQIGLLPQKLPAIPGYDFYAYYNPARMIGGDYYDFIPLPDGRLAIVLGDVAGKGVPAALLVAKLSSEVRYHLLTTADPALAVTSLNNHLIQAGLQDRFVTLAVLVLEPNTHQLTVVNAGHLKPKWARAGQYELVDLGQPENQGVPLGIVPDFPYAADKYQLDVGDTITLFTDGVTDALDAEGEFFGMGRVDYILRPEPDDPPSSLTASYRGQRLVEAVHNHAHGHPQNDDIAVVCFGRLPPGAAPSTGSPVYMI